MRTSFFLTLATVAALPIVSHAQVNNSVSNGSNAATGQTLVTMTMPKFAEFQNVPASWSFKITSTMYQANQATFPRGIEFFMRTNSGNGAKISVAALTAGDGRVNNITASDIGFVATSATQGVIASSAVGAVTTAPQQVAMRSNAVLDFTETSNVRLTPVISNLNLYHVGGTGPSATKDFTNTLLFTMLPQ